MYLVNFFRQKWKSSVIHEEGFPRDITMLMCHRFNELTSRIQGNHERSIMDEVKVWPPIKKMFVKNLLYMHHGAIFIIFQNKTLKCIKKNK
jgi:hypothetical protein